MVRRCAVTGCNSTDVNSIAHRFPRKIANTEQWRQSLQLIHIDAIELMTKYVVCTKHFSKSDYRNEKSKRINHTAIPKLTPVPARVHTDDFIYNVEYLEDDEEGDDDDNDDEYKGEIIKSTPIVKVVGCNFESVIEYMEDDCNIIYESIKSEEPTKSQNDFQLQQNICASSNVNQDVFPISLNEKECDEQIETELSIEEPLLPDSSDNNEAEVIIGDILEDNILYNYSTQMVDRSQNTTPDCHIEITDENKDFIDLPRSVLIQELVGATRKIADLESKLEVIQSTHAVLTHNFNVFKNLLK